jgi:hypothetical protein
MRTFARSLGLLGGLFLASFAQSVLASSVDLSTGLDSSNNLITTYGQLDANWTVTTLGGPAPVITPAGPDWWFGCCGGVPPYATNGPNSDWISNDAANAFNPGVGYSFNRTFDLTGVDLSTFSLSGSWSVADGGTLSLNGNLIASLDQNINPWGQLWAFSVPAGSSFLNQGMNTLTITVTESNQVFEAARLDMAPVAGTTPEPSAMLLMGTGLLALAGKVRRRFFARK